MRDSDVAAADPPAFAERGARACVAAAAFLVAITIGWVAWRASVPGDGAPVIPDPGFQHGLTVDPLPGRGNALRGSDVVVAINGIPVDLWLRGDGRSPTDGTRALTYEMSRNGSRRIATVATDRSVVTGPRFRANSGGPLSAIVILGLGAFAVYRRRSAAAAHSLLLLGAGLVAYSAFTTFSYETSDIVYHRAVFIAGFVGGATSLLAWSMAASYLALTFPRPLHVLERRRRALLAGYATTLAAFMATTLAVLVFGSATLSRLNALTSVSNVLLGTLSILTVAGLFHTFWRAWRDPSLRPQSLLVAIGFATTAIGIVVANLIAGNEKWPAWLVLALLLPLPAAVTIAILRGEFLGIRAVLNRTLVYITLTALLLAVYAGAVTGIGAIIGHGGVAREVAATAAVAIAFAPLRAALQRGVDKLLYGARGDTAQVLRAVGQRIEDAADPADVLPAIAEAVASALNLPYVAVRILAADGMRLAAERGERGPDLHRVPLLHHGTQVGELAVAARRGEKLIGATDASVLSDVARQVAPAVRAARLVTDLAASHNRLALTREEERAQLRHDLHDRLGPHLVGLSLQLDALSSQVRPGKTAAAVNRAHEEAALALEEIRRISRGLRPAELEDLGLVQAIDAAATRLSIADSNTTWVASVDAAAQLGEIPPDIEATAYQIALEGLTNAYRHSGGSTASVRVGVTTGGSALIVEVSDDGTGIDPAAPGGIGIRSMHARAQAVGGEVTIGRTVAGGTAVRARLPLP